MTLNRHQAPREGGSTDKRTVVAYLAPEIPALSATFVYEELLAVERRGYRVVPISVRAPAAPASSQRELARRTEVLYGKTPLASLLLGAVATLGFGHRSLVALRLLLRDMIEIGVSRGAAWKLAYQWLVAARLGRHLRRAGCAHLHVHFAHVPAQIAMYASAFTGIPFTVTAHANDIFERGALLVEKATRARMLLTISQHNLEYLASRGVPREKLDVVRCGVSFVSRVEKPRAERRSRYRIGSLGRLVEKKGMDDVMRAVALLSSEPWSVEFSIAGDGPLRGALEVLAADLGVRERVRFEGALPHDAVSDWMHSLDVFVLASKPDARGDMDGIPVVLMEAMSQRVPVVSTRLSGIPELVMDGTTGLLVPPADPAALAAALRRMIEDSEMRARLNDAAVQHVEVEFGQQVNIDRLLRYLPAPR